MPWVLLQGPNRCALGMDLRLPQLLAAAEVARRIPLWRNESRSSSPAALRSGQRVAVVTIEHDAGGIPDTADPRPATTNDHRCNWEPQRCSCAAAESAPPVDEHHHRGACPLKCWGFLQADRSINGTATVSTDKRSPSQLQSAATGTGHRLTSSTRISDSSAATTEIREESHPRLRRRLPFCRSFALRSELVGGIKQLEIRDGRADNALRNSCSSRATGLRMGRCCWRASGSGTEARPLPNCAGGCNRVIHC